MFVLQRTRSEVLRATGERIMRNALPIPSRPNELGEVWGFVDSRRVAVVCGGFCHRMLFKP